MKHVRSLKHVLLAMTLISVGTAFAQMSNEPYPKDTFNAVLEQRQQEAFKTDDMERELAAKKDRYEQQRREIDKQVAKERFEIEQLRTKQSSTQQELDLINANLRHVSDEISTYQDEHKKIDADTEEMSKQLAELRSQLENSQKLMEQELANLNMARKRAEKSVYDKNMEIQHMKAEGAHLETKIAAIEAKRAGFEAEEMTARADWMQTKMEIAELNRQKDDAIAMANDAKNRFNVAQRDLDMARQDLGRTKKTRDQVVAQTTQQVAKYEADILAANKSRIAGEAEQIRLTSETEKMREYASRIRDTRDDAFEKTDDMNTFVLRTKVALETARTELTKKVQSADQKALADEKEFYKRRGLAAAADASAMVGGTRIWTTSAKCKAFSKPMPDSEPVGYFESGKRLLGKNKDAGWVEITSGTGSTVFMETRCGEYEH